MIFLLSNIRGILIKYWGFSSFRPLQEDIILSVLEGNDTLALLPTGGGKSICYQVPALAMEGMCLVITPLIALMKDQVEGLQKRGIKAEAIHSALNQYQIERIRDNAVNGELKFLFVSPERLISDGFTEFLINCKICLLAVDEAHCVSQWGYDFRPPYLRIAEIRPYLHNVPVLALTATATAEVKVDIQDKLQFRKRNLLQKSFERKNLAYVVLKEENKIGRLLKIVNSLPGSGIVYVRSRKRTVEISGFLAKNKISSAAYHAGMSTPDRSKQQDHWMKNQIRVIVSTNAFGMGIDKPDVRFVVHYDVPENIEAYFQEAGRAGRDEKKAFAVLMFEDSDLMDAADALQNAYPEIDFIKTVYNALGNYYQIPLGNGCGRSFDFDIHHFCDQYQLNGVQTFSALGFLERQGLITQSPAMHKPSELMFSISAPDLYQFQVERKQYDPFIKAISRLYGGLHTIPQKIHELQIARKTGLKVENVIALLHQLHKMQVVTYWPQSNKPQITYNTERLDKNNISISKEVYSELKSRAHKRLDAILNYASTTNRCRSQLLLQYFGESVKRCGQCDYCLQRNKAELSEYEFRIALEGIKPIITSQPIRIDDLFNQLPQIAAENIIKTVQHLLETGKIIQTEDGMYSWNKNLSKR